MQVTYHRANHHTCTQISIITIQTHVVEIKTWFCWHLYTNIINIKLLLLSVLFRRRRMVRGQSCGRSKGDVLARTMAPNRCTVERHECLGAFSAYVISRSRRVARTIKITTASICKSMWDCMLLRRHLTNRPFVIVVFCWQRRRGVARSQEMHFLEAREYCFKQSCQANMNTQHPSRDHQAEGQRGRVINTAGVLLRYMSVLGVVIVHKYYLYSHKTWQQSVWVRQTSAWDFCKSRPERFILAESGLIYSALSCYKL